VDLNYPHSGEITRNTPLFPFLAQVVRKAIFAKLVLPISLVMQSKRLLDGPLQIHICLR
jgi:hypothetical protein